MGTMNFYCNLYRMYTRGPHLEYDVYGHSEPTDQYIRIFMLIAVLILFISVINYVNLSTARSTMRAREVGIRKVFGAHRAQLIRQFMGESFFLCLISYFNSYAAC